MELIHSTHSPRSVLEPPYCQSTGIGGYLQEMLYLIIANTILWCVVMALASHTLRAILKAKNIYSTRMRRMLVIYIVLMTVVSTISLALFFEYTHRTFFSPFEGGLSAHRRLETLIGSSFFITLPFAVFGADGLMLWRCWVLYQGVYRLLRFVLFCILISLLFVSLATAVWIYLPLISIPVLVLPLIGATLMTNLLLSVLIMSRLLIHERSMRKAMGVQEKSSPFRKVIAICVESCALIIACGVFTLPVIWRDSTLFLVEIPITFLPHICAISPFLIIIRVAKGRAPSSTTLPVSMAEHPLQFAHPASTTIMASVPPGFTDATESSMSVVAAV